MNSKGSIGGRAAGIVAAIFVLAAIAVKAGCLEHTLQGWAWSSNFKLFSLSCGDQENWDPAFNPLNTADYGLDVENNELSGYAWSSHLGWMCFGSTCIPGGGGGARDGGGPALLGPIFPPDGEEPRAVVNPETHAVSGWARIWSLASEPGGGMVGGWVALDCATALEGAENCLGGNQPECPGWCTVFDPDRSVLTGWGWNASNQGVGVGWIDFEGMFAPRGQLTPWVRTDLGDIYSQKGFTGQDLPPEGDANATFLLTGSGPIDRWITKMDRPANWPAGRAWPDPEFDELEIPKRENSYKTELGTLFVDDLIIRVDGEKNRFGHEVVELDPADIQTIDDTPLCGKVYHLVGMTTIGEPLMFKNGNKLSRDDQRNCSGSGLIVIDGALVVTEDVRYERAVIQNTIENLASVGWIIREAIQIAPAVGGQRIIGSITSRARQNLGQQAAIRNALVFASSVEHFAGLTLVDGGVNTGDDIADPHHLTVAGGLIARSFTFARTFVDEIGGNRIGSERIIYDGRARANPPPGLTELAKSLPIFKQVP